MGLGGEAEVDQPETYPNYETSTALSQSRPAEHVPQDGVGREQEMARTIAGVVPGPCGSSPTAMEMGLVASPFHSEMVQAEIQLRRSRPRTLDADAEAVGRGQRDPEGVVLEPDYSSMSGLQAGTEVTARVARVQTMEESQSTDIGARAGSVFFNRQGRPWCHRC